MTKKEKTAWVIGILVLIMTVTGFGFAVNSGACGFGSFQRPGFSKREMPPFMQDEIKSFILWRMDEGVKDLGLSDSQQEQYDIFRAQFQKTMEKALAARVEFKNKAVSTLENETPDLSGMAAAARIHVEAVSGAVSENLTRFAEFFNTLDPAQKKTITDKIKQRINDHNNSFPYKEKEI